MSDDPSNISTVRLRWPADRRDQIVGATLVGLVVVLLGYASGIGVEAPGAQAAGGGPASHLGPPAGPASDQSPVLVQAPSSSGGAPPTTAGGYVGAVPKDQPSNPGPVGGTTPGTASPTVPAPPVTPTPTGSQPPSTPSPPDSTATSPAPPESTGSQPSDPETSPSSGAPSSTPPTGTVLGGLLPPTLVPCLLDPLTAPLNGLLGLGDLFGTCPTTTSAGGAP